MIDDFHHVKAYDFHCFEFDCHFGGKMELETFTATNMLENVVLRFKWDQLKFTLQQSIEQITFLFSYTDMITWYYLLLFF